MVKFGQTPFLECSSKGDKRLSAFFAYVDGNSIENIYQGAKKFADGSHSLTPKEAKLKQKTVAILNMEECKTLYTRLWRRYFARNKELLLEIMDSEYQGFSDIFGQEGRVCQAEEIYNIITEQRENRLCKNS